VISPNNPAVAHIIATLKQHHATGTLAQGPVAALADALALTMQDTTAYAIQHTGVATSVAPSALVQAFHPHALADALALLRTVRGEPAPKVMVYAHDRWAGVDGIGVNSEEISQFDVAWAAPAPKAPPAPPVPPAPPAPPAPPVPQAPAPAASIAVPDSVLSALAAVNALPQAVAVEVYPDVEPVAVTPAEQVVITGGAAPIQTPTGPLPIEKERSPGAEIVPIVAQEPTRWYPGVPAPADIAPAPQPGKGRPKVSPFAKAHPPRKKVGSPSPFWRDMQPMIEGLFILGPANCPPDNTLGTLESFTQLVHVVRNALSTIEQGTRVGDVQAWLDDVWAQIIESPAWPAIEHSLTKYNAAGDGEEGGE
jgi:hypothetical protein